MDFHARRPLASLVLLGVALGAPACKGKDGAAGAAGAASGAAAASAASAAAATGAAPSGSTFEGAITMKTSSEHRPAAELTMLAKGDKVRVDVPTRDGQTAHSILDSDKKQVTVIVDAQKTAMTMSLPQVPPSTAAQTAPTVTKTGKHETIAGHDCEDWTVAEANGKRTELCMAEGMAFFDFGSVAPPGSAAQFGSWLTELKDKQEFPLRAISLDAAGKEESRMEVTKIDAKTLDDSLFAVPAGYRTMGMPGGMGGMGGPPGMGGMPPGMGGTHPQPPHR